VEPCHYEGEALWIERVCLTDIAAAVGTPCYVYSRAALEQHWLAFDAAFGDYLQEDPACRYQPTGQPLAQGQILWSAQCQARLERIPLAFIREKVKQGVETFARRQGVALVTPNVMEEALAGDDRSRFLGKMPPFLKQGAQREKGSD